MGRTRSSNTRLFRARNRGIESLLWCCVNTPVAPRRWLPGPCLYSCANNAAQTRFSANTGGVADKHASNCRGVDLSEDYRWRGKVVDVRIFGRARGTSAKTLVLCESRPLRRSTFNHRFDMQFFRNPPELTGTKFDGGSARGPPHGFWHFGTWWRASPLAGVQQGACSG